MIRKKFGSHIIVRRICRRGTTCRRTYCKTSRSSNHWRRPLRNSERNCISNDCTTATKNLEINSNYSTDNQISARLLRHSPSSHLGPRSSLFWRFFVVLAIAPAIRFRIRTDPCYLNREDSKRKERNSLLGGNVWRICHLLSVFLATG
jgi:hypothetical protein